MSRSAPGVKYDGEPPDKGLVKQLHRDGLSATILPATNSELTPMPPHLTLVHRSPGLPVAAARASFGQISRGELVTHDGRRCYVLGFDPIAGGSDRVYLEDAETHQPRTAAIAELARPRKKPSRTA